MRRLAWRPKRCVGTAFAPPGFRCLASTQAEPKATPARLPRGFWDSRDARRRFMEDTRQKLGLPAGDSSAWHSVSSGAIRKLGGAGLLNRYGGSVWRLLQDVYPELGIEGAADCRPAQVRNHWSTVENRQRFLESVKERLRIGEERRWTEVSVKEFTAVGGGGLLARYNGSLLRMLQDTIGEELEESERESYGRVASGHWDSRENRKTFLETVAREYDIRRPEDWARVSTEDVKRMGGSGMLSRYSFSLFDALRDIYDDGEEWTLYTCRPSVPAGHWESEENVRRYLLYVADRLELHEKEDWFRVSMAQIRAAASAGASLFHRMSLLDALRKAFPGEDWPIQPLNSIKRAVQRELLLGVRRVLPGHEVIEDYREEFLRSKASGSALELDLFVPSLKMALEYNGEHHYEEIPFFGPLESIQRRDREKRELCDRAGVSLVVIPYWWDRSEHSLLATIWRDCPRVLQDMRQARPKASL
mmetsp:Transcript_10344/g.42068  ORF Transcript_10344/g.42068 Transcript_10344/m.42068 type:complete len:475 (+) Transcript_10344:14-1438(+)